jgi:hypothetical protein
VHEMSPAGERSRTLGTGESEGEWSSNIVLHLMPKADFRKMDAEYVRDTKQVGLSFGDCPMRSLLMKLMWNGKYVCVCFKRVPFESEIQH